MDGIGLIMEEFLKQIGLLGGNAAGAGYGQSGVGPGGMGANNGLSQSQQPMFSMPNLTPEQMNQMQVQMGAEMLKQPEQQPKAPPPPIQQQQQQPQMPMDQSLAEILARYGLSTEEQQRPQPTWGGMGGGGFRNG